MAVLFDTLKLADRLEAAGMQPRQAHDTAEALADSLTGVVATAADVRETELRLKAEIATVRTELSELRGEMRAGDERLRGEIRDLHSRLVWWIIGTGAGAVLALTGIIAALLRLLH